MIRLDPMTDAEFSALEPGLIQGYARDSVQAGSWTEAEALERSRQQIRGLLTNGVTTPDQFLRTIRRSSDGTSVGTLWYSRRADARGSELFVYWIGIEPAHRRHGYAREAFELLEAEARSMGARQIALHVFGNNAGAIALYEGLGFQTTNRLMARPVGPDVGR